MTEDRNIPSLTTLTKQLDRWKVGDDLSARKFNQPVQFINEVFKGIKNPEQLISKVRGNVLIQQFKILAVKKDYLECKPFDGDEKTQTIVKVALPSLLRRNPFDFGVDEEITDPRNDGIKYTYTTNIERLADNDSKTETQVIQPSYLEDDIIYATKIVIGGTSVVTKEEGEEGEQLEKILWIDMNFDARAWAKKDGT